MLAMKHSFAAIDGFFFARRGAWPFGLMRIAWAGIALTFFMRQWPDLLLYYGDDGFLPREFLSMVTRTDWVFSILRYGGSAGYVWTWYILLLISLACSMLGIAPRTSTIASFIFMASFHERNSMTLGGGDTVLRNIGFILAITPGIQAISVSRLRRQWRSWNESRTLLPKLTMSAWPYRLLLWQIIVIYGTSLWWKLLGSMWRDGTAVGAALHHMVFLKRPYAVMNELMPFAVSINYATLLWEAAWLLLLIPTSIRQRIPLLGTLPLKRFLLTGGILFHGGIAFFMDVGCFSYAMLASYLGLLDETDRAWLTDLIKRSTIHPIVVLYDGSCRLCRRSSFGLAILDACSHLRLVNFRDKAAKNLVAPELDESQLDLAMHILLPARPGEALAKSGSSIRTGFDAFRCICRQLPLLWPLTPILSLPGMSRIGKRIYARIAKNRQKCAHNLC